LGLEPRSTPVIVQQELEKWQKRGVVGHWTGERPWMNIDSSATGKLAKIVGGLPIEVTLMGTLTANIHTLFIPFYRPTPQRYKIIIEKGAFPSDLYLAKSQVKFHGFTEEDAVIQLEPRAGEFTLRTEDIIEVINKNGSQLALLFLPGVQFYSGQCFDIETLTRAGQKVGAIVGWDLAHAVGNVRLRLHDWNVDFAAWCSYKYLNSGPGAVAGIFVNERYAYDTSRPRFAGWWGHDETTRFNMDKEFSAIPGAAGFRQSNVAVLTTACVIASVDIFDQVGMDAILNKQKLLTGYLELLLNQLFAEKIKIITPTSHKERGCQLSLLFLHTENLKVLEEQLLDEGIVIDARKNIIRVAPVPLYNSFRDIYLFISTIKKILERK